MRCRMAETVYSSAAALAQPGRFFAAALDDLRASPRIAWRLYSSEVRGRSRRTLLGYFWLVIPPAAATILCVYMQSLGILSVGRTELPYPLHVLSGVLLWQVFAEALHAPSRQLVGSRHLLSRSRVPHEALLFTALLHVILSAAIRLGLLVVATWLFAGPGGAGILLPAGLVSLILFGFALGLLVAPWAILIDDASHFLKMVATFWFVVTPVAYSPVRTGLLAFNPVTPLLDTARAGLGSGGPSAGFLATTVIACLVLGAAWLLNRVASPHVVERLG